MSPLDSVYRPASKVLLCGDGMTLASQIPMLKAGAAAHFQRQAESGWPRTQVL